MRASGRERKAAVLTSTAMAASVRAPCSVKAAPPIPSTSSKVAAHKGDKGADGRLTPFPKAPAWFRPNLTPHEMLAKGMHGGIYFNPKGGKPGVLYPRSKFPKGIPGVSIDEFPKEWFAGVPKELYLSRRYSTAHNCYGVKSGLDQAGWESSGWINQCDPRGWTQWYFRFFLGRRLPDGEDERQMSRWFGVCGDKGRWKQNLIAKCMRDGKAHDDASVSPVVRQTLLHWAYELSEADFATGAKRVKTHGATYIPRDQLAGVVTGKASAKRKWENDEDEDEEKLKRSAKEQTDERQRRAERRARSESSSAAASSSSGTRTGSKRSRKAASPAAATPTEELSAYEIARDERKALNAKKLKELGLK